MPRKSRDLGRMIWINLSRKSCMRGPLNVTFAPIGIPSLSLNPAIDFFAFVNEGFCPVISERSCTTFSFLRLQPFLQLISRIQYSKRLFEEREPPFCS